MKDQELEDKLHDLETHPEHADEILKDAYKHLIDQNAPGRVLDDILLRATISQNQEEITKTAALALVYEYTLDVVDTRRPAFH
jgi:hypothetical protein